MFIYMFLWSVYDDWEEPLPSEGNKGQTDSKCDFVTLSMKNLNIYSNIKKKYNHIFAMWCVTPPPPLLEHWVAWQKKVVIKHSFYK